MANRVLRDWTASETVDKLSERAEVFFTRLIMKADDYGCYYGNTKLLKAALFPLRDHQLAQIRSWRDECVDAGLLQFYTIDGKEYLKIYNFGQRMRSFVSKFPQPADNPLTIDGGARSSDSNPPPEGKRREEKGSGREQPPQDFFGSKPEAHKEITANYQDIESAKTILRNRGWAAVVDLDVGALLYHFLESTADVLSKPRQEVRQHFLHWLNKKDLNEMTKLSVNIQTNAARRGQRQVQGSTPDIPGNAGQVPPDG